MGIFFKT